MVVGEMGVGEMVGEMMVGEMVVGTSAFIVWVKGQQAVQPVLLFTPAVTITSLQGDPSFSTIEEILLDQLEMSKTQKNWLHLYLHPGLQRPSDISAWQVSMWMYCSNG